jgi:hypothetical protein
MPPARRVGGCVLAGRRGGGDAGAAFAQAVALAFEGDHGGVVHEAVDERGGDHRVAEDFAPGLESAVAGDDDRAAFVAAGDQGEEQVGGLSFEREVADLVDDQQLVALKALELLVEGVALLGLFEAGDPLLGGGERDPVATLAGLDPEGDREMGLACSRRVWVELLMLLMFCRSGCGWSTLRASCGMSSLTCWGGGLRRARLR